MRLAHDWAAGLLEREMEKRSAGFLLAVVLIILGASAGGSAGAAEPAVPPTSKATQVDKARLRYGGKSFGEWQELFLTDLEPATRIKALPALAKFGRYGYATEAAETITAAFVDDDRELLTQSIDAVAAIGSGAVPTLVELCKSGPGEIRRLSVAALGKMGADAAGAVSDLLDLLETIDGSHDKDEWDAPAIHYALRQIGAPSLPVLLERLNSPNRNIRVLAAYITGQFGSEAREATLLLRKAFKDDDPEARSVVGVALWQVAPEDEKVVASLREAIRGDVPRVGGAIVDAIEKQFAPALNNEGGFDENSAGVAFVNGVSLLAEAMRVLASSSGEREEPAAARAQHESARRWEFAGVCPLEGSDSDSYFATHVCSALTQLGAHAGALVPELARLAQSDHEHGACAAVRMLGRLGGSAAPALPALRSAIERRKKQGVDADADPLLQELIWAAGLIEPQTPPILAVPGAPAER